MSDEATFEAHLEGMDCGRRPCSTCSPAQPLAERVEALERRVEWLTERLDHLEGS